MLIEEYVSASVTPPIDVFIARSAGPAEHTLLVIHGGPDWDHTYLREPLVRLSESRRLVFVDLRGCGRSTSGLPAAQCNPDAATMDLIAVLDAVGAQRADVLGFSYGGLLAQRLALSAPERVRSLIVASSSIPPVPEDAYDDWPEVARLRAEEEDAWAGVIHPTPQHTYADALASIRLDVWRAESRDELRRRIEAMRFSADWAQPYLAGNLLPARPEDSQARLAALGLPILLLHGRQDMTFPAALAEHSAAEMPNAQAVVIDQAGHMAHIDAPEEWLRAITDFLG